MHKQDRFTRLGPLSGALFVALQLIGVAVSVAGGRSMATLGDSPSAIARDFSTSVDAAYWVGAYLELASVAAFCLFAAWLFRAADSPLAAAGRISVGVYATVTVVALVVGDVLAYRAGHGIGTQEIVTLFDLQSGLYFVTWGLSALFLALAPLSGRLRQAALAIAALQLIALAAPTAGPAQFPNMLFLIWCVAVAVKLGWRREVRAGVATAS